MIRDRRGQSTAEYAILIGVVIGALVAMQTHLKRGQQGRVKALVDYYTGTSLTSADITVTNAHTQYEPYYQESQFDVSRGSETVEVIDLTPGHETITKTITSAKPEKTVRGIGGYQKQRDDEEAD